MSVFKPRKKGDGITSLIFCYSIVARLSKTEAGAGKCPHRRPDLEVETVQLEGQVVMQVSDNPFN